MQQELKVLFGMVEPNQAPRMSQIRRAPVFEHELQRLAVQVARQVTGVRQVEFIGSHVHKVLVQLECPHMLAREAVPDAVLQVPKVLLALQRIRGATCIRRRREASVVYILLYLILSVCVWSGPERCVCGILLRRKSF